MVLAFIICIWSITINPGFSRESIVLNWHLLLPTYDLTMQRPIMSCFLRPNRQSTNVKEIN